MAVEAGLLVEGKQPQTTTATVVVSPAAGDLAQQAQRVEGAVAVEGSGPLALWTGHSGTYVAVFFSARHRSRALTPMLWTRSRSCSSLCPKSWFVGLPTSRR